MSFATQLTLLIAVFVLVACIAAAFVLMRLSDLKDATAAQAEADAEKLLAQANREVKKTRRVRAGTQGFTT